MESVVILAFSALCAFTIYYQLLSDNFNWLEPLTKKGIAVSDA
jgi:hypothetical protein